MKLLPLLALCGLLALSACDTMGNNWGDDDSGTTDNTAVSSGPTPVPCASITSQNETPPHTNIIAADRREARKAGNVLASEPRSPFSREREKVAR